MITPEQLKILISVVGILEAIKSQVESTAGKGKYETYNPLIQLPFLIDNLHIIIAYCQGIDECAQRR